MKLEARRLQAPATYGLAKDGELLPWHWAEERLRSAHNYWLATVTPQGRPHVAPVWGMWVENRFFFSTDYRSRKGLNLQHAPHATLHLESGDEVVIVEGMVAPAEDMKLLLAPYAEKYGTPCDFDPSSRGYWLTPTRAMGWTEAAFPTIATTWRFASAPAGS
ncbi:MAG: pyridoxamine 5'-phosphate oxidase family protein [Candidatus Xenobia bacterium]